MNIKILVACANQGILEVILRLTNANENWVAIGQSTIQGAVDTLGAAHFDLLLIGSGFTEAEEEILVKSAQQALPDLRISQHYGGGSGLLFAEIYQALS